MRRGAPPCQFSERCTSVRTESALSMRITPNRGNSKVVRTGDHVALPNETLFVSERQRPQQEVVDDAEHGGVRANPEGEGGERDRRSTRRAYLTSCSIA